MSINLKKRGILQNIHFRKALYHLINRQQMVIDLGQPRLYPSRSFQVSDKPFLFDKDWNVEMAVHLLQQSGYRGELIHLFTYKRHAPDAYWIQQEYQKYGIHVEVHIVSWGDMLQRENTEKADLILFEAVLSEGLIRQIEYYQSYNSFIRSHLDEALSSFVDQNIRGWLAEPGDKSKTRKLDIIEQKLKEEYALIFLVYKMVSTMSHPSLKGVKVNPRGWVDFKYVWFQND
jgi:SgrR family transcriptional regulator